MPYTNFDLAIVGAGAAGLHLALFRFPWPPFRFIANHVTR